MIDLEGYLLVKVLVFPKDFKLFDLYLLRYDVILFLWEFFYLLYEVLPNAILIFYLIKRDALRVLFIEYLSVDFYIFFINILVYQNDWKKKNKDSKNNWEWMSYMLSLNNIIL